MKAKVDIKEVEQFVREYMIATKFDVVDVVTLPFIRKFLAKLPTKSKNGDNHVRRWLNKLVDSGVMTKEWYNFGGGRYDGMGNNQSIGCNIYKFVEKNGKS